MTKRDIGQEILDSLRDIKQGKGTRRNVEVPLNVRAIRSKMKLSQTTFAALLGVSARTIQDWEQGRRKPQGPAVSLLKVARIHPESLREAIMG